MALTSRPPFGAVPLALATVLSLQAVAGDRAPETASPDTEAGLFLNEAFVAGLRQSLDIEDPLAVLRHILMRLPDEVRVYPSEHYYYFGFTAAGRRLVGNLRFAPDRDRGVVHLAYYDQDDTSRSVYRALDRDSGVTVEAVAPGRYRVTSDGRSVVFHLEELEQTPPDGILRPWESFVGRSQDESGMRFLLLYNRERPHFLWVLDEADGIPWRFDALADEPALHRIGPSGFIFHRDGNRWILVGVSAHSIRANDYFDGPFDQLPDDHLPKTRFGEWLQLAYPALKGRVDARGLYPEPGQRAAVNPYVTYADPAEVTARLQHCRGFAAGTPAFYRCLCHDWKQGAEPVPDERREQAAEREAG